MTAWTDTVKKTFKQGRLSNPSYQFKDALKDAKKFYKKGEALAVSAVKKTGKVAFKVKKGISKKLRKSMKKAKGLTKKARKAITFKKRKGGMGCKGKKMRGGMTYEKCVDQCRDDNIDSPQSAFDACVERCDRYK
jgi:hypothetical protein